MERLTKQHEGGYHIMDCPNCELNHVEKCTALACRNRLKERLAYYEDAEAEGRLVVLPCKVGGKVYRIYDDCNFPGSCGTKQMCKGCEYRNLFVEEQRFTLSMLSGYGKFGHPYYLTREEAEAALKGEGE